MVNIVKSIVFCLIQFAKMPILTAKAQQHLDNLSEPQRTSIKTQIGNCTDTKKRLKRLLK